MRAAVSGVSTCGATMPCAPLSSTRLAWWCSKPGTRTMGVIPVDWDATEICAAVSRSMLECSMSMNSQS